MEMNPVNIGFSSCRILTSLVDALFLLPNDLKPSDKTIDDDDDEGDDNDKNSNRLYPLMCQCTLRLLPCLGYCKQCCYEYQGACIQKMVVNIHIQ